MVKINKAKKNTEDVELQDDLDIEDGVDTEETEEVTMTPEDQDLDAENDGVIINTVVVDDTPAEVIDGKRVRVHLKADHRCNIGGEWYVFKAGDKPLVPENVRDILLGADLLLPL